MLKQRIITAAILGPLMVAGLFGLDGGGFAIFTGGVVALALGPCQFLSRLRESRPRIHRWTGRLYLTAVLRLATDDVLPIEPMTFAEDFSFLANEAPGTFFWLGAALPRPRMHHEADFDIDESALPLGAATLAASYGHEGSPPLPCLAYRLFAPGAARSWIAVDLRPPRGATPSCGAMEITHGVRTARGGTVTVPWGIASILRYIDLLDRPSDALFEVLRSPSDDPNVIVLPQTVYEPVAEDFIRELYERSFVLSFDWGRGRTKHSGSSARQARWTRPDSGT